MLYTSITQEGNLFLSLHGEQVYQNFNRFDSNLGFFTSEITVDTIERIESELKIKENITNVVIDCNLIDDTRNCDKEFERIIDLCIKNKFSISLIRVNASLYGKLNLHILKLNKSFIEISNKDNTYFDLFSEKSKQISTDKFDNFIFNLYSNVILYNKLKDCYCKINPKEYSDSSNVKLPKYINIKKFIEDTEVCFIGIYFLCKKAIEKGLVPDYNTNEKRPIVFFQSIVGGYLASIFSKIALLDIAYLDHIGPINKIYKTILKKNFKKHREYLLISDVICMGTEIQIAKNIIEFENSKVIGYLTIIYIEVISKIKEDKTCSLFRLTKDNNEGIDYKIETNF